MIAEREFQCPKCGSTNAVVTLTGDALACSCRRCGSHWEEPTSDSFEYTKQLAGELNKEKE